jgi:hypothetical protein
MISPPFGLLSAKPSLPYAPYALSVSVKRFGEVIVFDFHANAFLHHMIRNLVGSLVYVGKGRLSGDVDGGACLPPASVVWRPQHLRLMVFTSVVSSTRSGGRYPMGGVSSRLRNSL